jgi:outer membrane protein OmpA-like peptidoglycan-associated protein/tetratricopeptide (TPR) repeat protein
MMTTTSIKNSLLASLLVFSLVANAQNKSLTRANNLFDAKSYAEAIEKYEAVLKKNKGNSEALKKIADSYRLNNNSVKAEDYYSQLYTLKKATAEDVLNYAQALMNNGKYDKAKEIWASPLLAGDKRAANYSKSLENISTYYKDSASVKIKKEATLNSPDNDFSPFLLKGDLVFTSTRERTEWIREEHSWSNKVYNQIYIAKKEGASFSKPKIFSKEYSSKYNDGPASFTADGKKMLFSVNSLTDNKRRLKDELMPLQIYTSTQDADDNSYQGLEPFPFNNDAYNCAHPAISADGSMLVFSSDMPGSVGGMDLWLSKMEGGKWGKPENLGDKINTAGNEVFPYLSIDGSLYFSSNGWGGLGGLDLYVAAGTAGKWNGASNMNAPFNSKMDDFGITMDKDGKTGYFSSNRANRNMNDDIYSFARNTVLTKKIYAVKVKDEESKALINSSLEVKDVKTGEITKLQKTDGLYSLELMPGEEYMLLTKADGYIEKSEKLTASSESTDILLKKDVNKNCITGIVLDKSNNNKPADDATVVIKDNSGAKVFETVTGLDGKYSKCDLDKEKTYTVTTSKKGGYFTKTEGLKVPATEVKTTELEKIVVGKAIKIDNIYFDLGKAAIRPDASNELNKTVLLLNDNPDIIVELSSHTDCRGSVASNLALSQARAKSSVEYIISKGIDKKRITGKGYGESQLTNNCPCEGAVKSTCSETEHQQNRRTEFKVTGFAKTGTGLK